jgi:hypothetical protein
MIMNKELLQKKFEQALPYNDFIALGEAEGTRPPWDERYGRLELSEQQHKLISSFVRPMKVLSLTGRWCGDCALQGAAMARIAEANDNIELRFIQRDEEHADLVVKSAINAGFRVPVSWWLAEDFEPVSTFGDRTLSRYRSMARKQLPQGAVVINADPPEDPVRQVLNELIDEFERVHLLLRLSGRFRQKYGD